MKNSGYNGRMRRGILYFMLLLLTACQVLIEAPATIAPTIPKILSTADPTDPVSATGWQVQIHPGEILFVGDKVSFEVFNTEPSTEEVKAVSVFLDGDQDNAIGRSDFGRFGIGSRRQATLTWIWDTEDLLPGDYDLRFQVEPAGPVFTETITLHPAESMPLLEAYASWAEVRTSCCVINYLTHSEVERDIEDLTVKIEAEAQRAAMRMGIGFSEPVSITLMPRLLGHGGFADDAIHVSYLDRNAVGGESLLVVHHELVHILDRRLGGDLRPNILVEGLAVYLSGGHFKPEPLLPRAAVLLEHYGNPAKQGLDRYIPLRDLARDFYTSHHEIGYLEAGALVEYMIGRWGWGGFNSFYRDIKPVNKDGHDQGQDVALDEALQRHFNLTLEELENDFLAVLAQQTTEPIWKDDVRLTIQHFDTLRRYQQALDPAAYFLTAWIVDEKKMRELGITADYLRRPDTPLHTTLELLLGASGQALIDGRLSDAEEFLEGINLVLDSVERGDYYPGAADGLTFTVFERVGWLHRRGLSPQTLAVEENWLVFGVRIDGIELKTLRLPRKW